METYSRIWILRGYRNHNSGKTALQPVAFWLALRSRYPIFAQMSQHGKTTLETSEEVKTTLETSEEAKTTLETSEEVKTTLETSE